MTEADITDGIRTLMATPQSRAQLWWFLGECNIFATTFVPGQPDLSAYNEGARSKGLQLIERLEQYAPGSVDLMKKEASNVQVEDTPAKGAANRRKSRRRDAASRGDYDPLARAADADGNEGGDAGRGLYGEQDTDA